MKKYSLLLVMLLNNIQAPILRTISTTLVNSKKIINSSQNNIKRRKTSYKKPVSGMILYDLMNKKTIVEKGSKNIIPPASLAKIMTFYIAVEMIKKGKISLNDQITVSKVAAAQMPTKLGLKPGEKIKLKDALMATMILSANDAAYAVGEYIGGKEVATLMNKYAAKLNMNNTIFRNATGLYHRESKTTPKDILKLIVALRRYHPDFMHYGENKTFCYNGLCRKNHNPLVGRVQGVQGLKTGFLAHCGWHVATYSKIHNQEFVGVFMGHSSASERNDYAAQIIKKHNKSIFESDSKQQSSKETIFTQTSSKQIKPIIKPINKTIVNKIIPKKKKQIRTKKALKKTKNNHEDFLASLV